MKKSEMIRTTIRLPKKLSQRARIQAVKEERTFQDITIDALKAYLKVKGGRK